MSAGRPVELRMVGYFPGVVGKITELHAVYYNENWGFEISFETQVGKELSEFLRDFEQSRDFFRVALMGKEFAGAIAMDGRLKDVEGVRLRWFIVHPRYHGKGIGSALINDAMDFCRKTGYRRIFLWTFQGLDEARSLYEKAGFHLTQEHPVFQWGREINEQMFEMILT